MKKCILCQSSKTYKWYKGPICGECYRKNLYLKNREEKLKYEKEKYEQNKKPKLKYQKEYYEKNREEKLKYEKDRYENNKEEKLIYQKQYYAKNKKDRAIYAKKYETEKTKTDPIFKLKKRIRTRLKVAMKGNYKSGMALEYLGCSIKELKIHLESLFQPGMTWDNYGKEWEIDHKMPLFKFDLTNPLDLSRVCHYTNLQPLFKRDHYVKTRKDLESI